jgi:hypothetical protein
MYSVIQQEVALDDLLGNLPRAVKL